MRLSTISENKSCCPSCGKKFKKDEPYPDVENCEVCERYGPPVKESYEGLEDADVFSGGCSICGSTNGEWGQIFDKKCPECEGEICDECSNNSDNAHCVDCGATICTDCDTREDPGSGMVCADCWEVAQDRDLERSYEDAWEANQGGAFYESAGYEGLEDADEFQNDNGYDPILDEFDYRFLGTRTGHEFTFRGNTYHVYTGWGRDGRDVEKDGELIGNAHDEVPWEEFEYNAIGEHLPAQRWTWYDLVEVLYNMYGPADNGDPPPGVGV